MPPGNPKPNYSGSFRPERRLWIRGPELAAAAAALTLFLGLGYGTLYGATRPFDFYVRDLVHTFASPLLTEAMQILTIAGGYMFLLPLTVAVVLYLVRARRYRAARFFAIGAAVGEIFEQVFKGALHRIRPTAFFGLESPTNFSFPSGHALMSCVIYGMLAAAVAVTLRGRLERGAVWGLAATLVGAIGFSRIYLGVHWPTDVIGGYSLGVAWLLGLQAFWRR